jgi:DNA polymerase-1
MSFSEFIEVTSRTSCFGCNLDRRDFVPSKIVPGSQIVFVGEAPGRNEVMMGEPFVGKSGQLIKRACDEEGVETELCSWSNVVSCRPPGNYTPDSSLMKRCGKNHLYPQLLALRPKLIVLLGGVAYGYFFDLKSWGKWRHNFRRSGEFVFLTLRHPAYVLRQYSLSQEEGDKEYSLLRRDVAKARKYLEGTLYSDREYTAVSTVEEAEKWAEFLSQQAIISADIEAIPFRSWHPNSRLLSVAFSWADKKSVCFPLEHRDIVDERFKDAVRKALDQIFRTVNIKVWHNAKFDTSWLRECGWVINGKQVCTMILAYLCNENRGKGQYGLKQLSAVELDGYNEIVEGNEFESVGLERLCLYNNEDADNTRRLYFVLKPGMDSKLWWVHNNLMIPGGEALAEAERVGVLWNLQANGKLKSELEAQIKKTVIELDQKLPGGKTVTSADDLREHFYQRNQDGSWEEKRYPVISTTPKGVPQVTEYTLTVLSEDHNCKIAKQIIEMRKMKKKVETYLNGFPKHVSFDGRIHTNFWLTNTTTGRTAAEKPPLQQIPRDSSIRELVSAADGMELMEGDLSNAEMRVAASLSRDPVLCEAFMRDADIHRLTAAQVNGISEKEVTDDLRQKAKPVNFGFLYGQQPEGFIRYARAQYKILFSLEEASEIRDRYFETYSGLLSWYREVIEELYSYNSVRTVFGRLRRFPGLGSLLIDEQEACQRQAINTLVQSPSADLMLRTFIHTQDELIRRGMRSRAILTVHDSLLAEGPPEEISTVARIAHDYVDSFDYPWLTVPMKMDFKRGSCWSKDRMQKMKKDVDF